MKTRSIVVAACILLGLGSSSTSADEVVIDKIHKTRLERRHVVTISKIGARVVGEIEAAREAITKRDRVKAKRRTGHAVRELQHARAASPTLRIHDAIGAAQARLARDGRLESSDLLPVMADLQSVTLEEGEEIREHLEAAQTSAKKGKTEDVDYALVQAAAAIQYTEIDLPIDETQHQLAMALHMINRRDLAGADQHLEAAQQKVHVFVGIANTAIEEVEADEVED